MFLKQATRVGAAGLCWLCIFILSACSPQRDVTFNPWEVSKLYLPPTAVPTTIPPESHITQDTPSPIIQPSTSMPEPSCQNSLRFIEDLTIPDGTQVNAGQILDKRWKVENAGTCNWDDRFRLKLIAGSELGATLEQALYPARSGTEASIRIVFTAPNEPGRYRSAWQAYSPQGEPFGDPFFIEVMVPEITPTARS